jgi:hypothetical protein
MKPTTQSPFSRTVDPPSSDTPLPLSARIGVARDLLISLNDATRSGQRPVMCRVLHVLQGGIIGPSVRLSHPQVVAIMAAVTELQHEAARAAPDIALFCARARLVIDVLSIT